MPLNTLIDDVRGWINRSSFSGDRITTMVRMAETRFNRELRVEETYVETTVNFDTSLGYADLTGMLIQEIDYVKFQKNPSSDSRYLREGRALKSASLAQVQDANRDTFRSGAPYHALAGSKLYAALGNGAQPLTGVIPLAFGYYKKVDPIGGAADTPLFANHYDIYLYATLIHTAPYLQEDDRIATWGGAASDTIAAANLAWQNKKMSGGPLANQRRGFG